MLIALVLLLLFLIAASAFSSASEIALFSLSNLTVQNFSRSGIVARRQVAKLLRSPQALFVTLFIVNISVNLLIQNVSSKLFGVEAGWIAKVGVSFLLVLILGEILPKYIAMSYNRRLAEGLAPVIMRLTSWIAPIREAVLRVAMPLSRALFFFLRPEPLLRTEEIRSAIGECERQGVVNNNEADLMRGVLDFQQMSAKDLMRPKDEVVYYSYNEPVEGLGEVFSSSETSRIPVCASEDLQSVVGVLSCADYLRSRKRLKSVEQVRRLLHKPHFVPESTPAERLYEELKAPAETILFVVDEHRSVVGLVTTKELAQALLQSAETLASEGEITWVGPSALIATAKLELVELQDIVKKPLLSAYGSVTLGGWLAERMGHIPQSGELYEEGEMVFQILAAEPSHVKKVYIQLERGDG